MKLSSFPCSAGEARPFGIQWIESEQSFNFAVYSQHATGVILLAYRRDDPVTPVFEYRLNYPAHKTWHVWHCRVPESALNGATLYAYRMEGPWDPAGGLRFDPDKVLLDPYAPSVFFPPDFSRQACSGPGSTKGRAPLGVLQKIRPLDLPTENDSRTPAHALIIYELHVKGFTMRANSGVSTANRGTFAGLTEKIPYLQDLGVTVVELLPIHQFDPQEANYWGYMTLHFFSPHQNYATGNAFEEFRTMVDAFHRAGIEVWLDVVYNHTTEDNADGPTYSFRGLDNSTYYLLSPDSKEYVNDTGCGNTLRTGHLATRGLILNSLRFWAKKMGVDGFRFDLASILSRASDGSMSRPEASILEEISWLSQLWRVRVVAEAWDLASYQLGRRFPGRDWMQWNGLFRDQVRSFVRGERGLVGALMQRLYGSDDLFPDALQETCRPQQSLNFITAHDGFCLYDLVAYDQKHNEANGHQGTDGTDDNRSWNCGHEGDEGAPAEVLALRRQQAKNFCALLLLSNGIPMITAGDEFLNTQRGNNNPYNQDNEITWLDWDRLAQNRDIFRFFKGFIAFRKSHPSIGRTTFWRGDVTWYGPKGPVDFGEESRSLGYHLRGANEGDDDLFVMINAHWDDQSFQIMSLPSGHWVRVVDTALPSPEDIREPGTEPVMGTSEYLVKARSIVVLKSSLNSR